MKITISGGSGSGKSVVAKKVAERLGYKHYSVGDLQREVAKDKGITIAELGELESKDDSIDKAMDAKTEEIGKTQDNFVMDGWLTARFVPDALKIFLDGDIDVRAKRITGIKREAEGYKNIDDAKRHIGQKEKTNQERWKRYYGFDFMDQSNYDIVIDTTNLDIEGVVGKVLEFVDTFK